MSGKITKSAEERFNEKWTPEPYSGCWIWTAGLSDVGYGKMWFNGKLQMAHRVSYELSYGAIPVGLYICHRCDVKMCVNPEHLFAGKQSDNILDAIKKGIQKYVRGRGIRWETVRRRNGIRKRRMFCKRGHPLSGTNLYISPRGHAGCQECRRESTYAHNRRKKIK